MRRLISYIVLVASMFLLFAFNVQSGVESINWSQEFDRGTEVVYRVNHNENDIDHIVEVMGNRLEDAGATNYTIETAQSETVEGESEVRIVLGSRNTQNIDNILRSTMTSGEFSLFTTDGMNTTTEVPLKRGTAEILYNDETHQPYVRVETTKDVETLITKAKDEVGDGLLVLWQNKTEDFDYSELSDPDYICEENKLTSSQLQNRVLAVIDFSEVVQDEEAETPTVDYSSWGEGVDAEEGKYFLTFNAFGYADGAESSQVMNTESGKSFVRILNSELLECEIEEVYRLSAKEGYGSLAKTLVIVAMALVIVIVSIVLLCVYGLTSLSGILGILLTVLAEIGFVNFFAITVTPVVILLMLVTLAAATSFLCVYYNRMKEEAYRGRALSKASNDGFAKAIPSAIDISIVTFVISVVLALISREAIKPFSLLFIFSSLASILFVIILPKVLNGFLFESSVGEDLKLFKLNPNYVQDLDGNAKEEIKPNVFENIDVKAANKPASIATFALIAASVLGIIGFSIVGSTFNFSNTSTFTRIEVRSADTRIFETGSDSGVEFKAENTALENLVYYIENVNATDGIKVEKSWTVTNQTNPYEDDKNYIYFYADIEGKVESITGTTTFEKLSEYIKAIDNNEVTTLVNAYTVDAGVIVNDYLNSFVLMAVALGITLVYFLIRYRYTFAISSVATLLAGSFISVGLVSLTRLEASAYVGAGILAGLLINLLFLIPLANRMNQLKDESKVKITVLEQREEIAYKALKDSISTYAVSTIVVLGLLVVLSIVTPIQLLPVYVATAISVVVNACVTIFTNIPLHLWLEQFLKFDFIKSMRTDALKAQRENVKKHNRNKGAEPEEIIIPGIND